MKIASREYQSSIWKCQFVFGLVVYRNDKVTQVSADFMRTVNKDYQSSIEKCQVY